GLPGNPVASFVCYHLYVWPILRALCGAPWRDPLRQRIPAGFDFKGRKTGRREYWRCWLETSQTSGETIAQKFPKDGSGLISSIRVADGLIEVPEEAGDVKVGDHITYIPLAQFAIPASR
ncbi:MAG: molybdopterin molybdenumtransferase MoeA, partial [Pseudomonadota bacterium]